MIVDDASGRRATTKAAKRRGTTQWWWWRRWVVHVSAVVQVSAATASESAASSSGRLLKYRVERRCTTPKYAPPPPPRSPDGGGDSDWCGVGNTRFFPGCFFLERMPLCVRWGDRTHRRGRGRGRRTAVVVRCCAVCCGRWGRSGASLLGYSRWMGRGGGCCRTAWEARKGPGCSFFFGSPSSSSHRSFIRCCRALTAAVPDSPGGFFFISSPVSPLFFCLARCNSSHGRVTTASKHPSQKPTE